jgi:hypothetical protein
MIFMGELALASHVLNVFLIWILWAFKLIFVTIELPIDENRGLLRVHPLHIVVVKHVGNNGRNIFVVVFLGQLEPLWNDLIQNLAILNVKALVRRQQNGGLKKNQPQIKNVTFVQNIFITDHFLLASMGDQHLWGKRYKLLDCEFLILLLINPYEFLKSGFWDQLIRQHLKAALVIKNVFARYVLVSNAFFLEKSQSVCYVLYEPLNIL